MLLANKSRSSSLLVHADHTRRSTLSYASHYLTTSLQTLQDPSSRIKFSHSLYTSRISPRSGFSRFSFSSLSFAAFSLIFPRSPVHLSNRIARGRQMSSTPMSVKMIPKW